MTETEAARVLQAIANTLGTKMRLRRVMVFQYQGIDKSGMQPIGLALLKTDADYGTVYERTPTWTWTGGDKEIIYRAPKEMVSAGKAVMFGAVNLS
jgi:hypothetical protein